MPETTSSDSVPSGITSVLDRTTPRDVAPLDLRDLARRGRRRRRRNRGVLGGAVAAVVAVLATAVVGPWSKDDGSPDLNTAVAGPDGQPLVEPVGSWSPVADPPFSARIRAFGGTLSDGRVLVWGGEEQDAGESAPTAVFDGGIYDPGSGRWTPIPEAPLPSIADGAATVSVYLAGDRLAVVAGDVNERTVVAAVYDVGDERWHEVPSPGGIGPGFAGVAWDGETLALVVLGPSIDEPATLRWRVGESRWQPGARPPLSRRSDAGTAFDGSRLALWGGTTSDPTRVADATGPDPGVVADGAVYDLGSDTWQALPASPLSARRGAVMAWTGGRLVVAGGWVTDLDDHLTDLASYDPSTDTWEALPDVPDDAAGNVWTSRGPRSGRSIDEFTAGATTFVVADAPEPQTGLIPRWFLAGDRWELAPASLLDAIGDLTIASTDGGSIGMDARFAVRVRTGQDTWLDAAEAPFGDLRYATIVPADDTLLVVGGWETDYETPGAAWVFDPAG